MYRKFMQRTGFDTIVRAPWKVKLSVIGMVVAIYVVLTILQHI